MSRLLSTPAAYLRTVRLLLAAARRREAGRRKRQRELVRQRTGRAPLEWGWFGAAVSVVLMAGLNVVSAYVVSTVVTAGEQSDAERQGAVLVERWFIDNLRVAERQAAESDAAYRTVDYLMEPSFFPEALRLANDHGGDRRVIEQRLRATVAAHEDQRFADIDRTVPGLKAPTRIGAFPAMLGSIALGWWLLMLAFQGEGLDLDTQRRRHPMWEWLFSHPVPTGAVFLAEMLAPIAANPIYYGAPVLPGILYGIVYGPAMGVLAGVIIGIPLAVAAACLGKGLEIGVVLRLSARSRGAVLGLMGWFGYASMMLFVVATVALARISPQVAEALQPLARIPWPWLGLFLGQRSDGKFLFPLGLLFCWSLVAVIVASSVGLALWGAQIGVGGQPGRAAAAPRRLRSAAARNRAINFGREPLYRKELLWFMRDRGALVQVVLVPLMLLALQVLIPRGMIAESAARWNYLCAVAILFGTYFLGSVGPKSLASEGSALWIALTWPRGLESLLKGKARLWATIASVIVGLLMCYTIYLFPDSIWKVGLVAAGWVIFARGVADKTVTLAAITASSGEVERAPTARRWAVQLGTVTFAIGVLSQQWPLAVLGIAYSAMSAAAMWRNFRARVPYLYDSWSEEPPNPPTLMHAMIALGILADGTAIALGGTHLLGAANVALARSVVDAAGPFIVWLGVVSFLWTHRVPWRAVWLWPATDGAPARRPKLPTALLAGAGAGLALGFAWVAYLLGLHQTPALADLLGPAPPPLDAVPYLRESLAAMTVLAVPVAEEVLFRGLLYRALDREWGGWRAALGSAAFFAVCHPLVAWLPLALLGLASAWLFKRTGRLAPSVLLHMVCNAVALSF